MVLSGAEIKRMKVRPDCQSRCEKHRVVEVRCGKLAGVDAIFCEKFPGRTVAEQPLTTGAAVRLVVEGAGESSDGCQVCEVLDRAVAAGEIILRRSKTRRSHDDAHEVRSCVIVALGKSLKGTIDEDTY